MEQHSIFVKRSSPRKGIRKFSPKKQSLLPLRPSYLTHMHLGKEKISATLRNEVQIRDDYSCRYCGHRVFGGKNMQTHHLQSTENVRANLVTCCIACHTIQHIGRGLMCGTIEIWKSPLPQLEIVRMTRKSVAAGKTLASVKKRLKLAKGFLDPKDPHWTKILKPANAKDFFTYLDSLDKNLKVIFVNFKTVSWQIN